jgi:hypothetical protein
MDGTLLLAGLWHRFRRGRNEDEWEEQIAAEVELVAATGEQHVKVMIPALQSELGHRLEIVTNLMKAKSYRLHMVTPDVDLMWAAGYEKVPEDSS